MARRPHKDRKPPAINRRGKLWIVGILVVVGSVLGVILFTPYLGEGLHWLMPTTRRQLVGGLGVAAVLVVLTIWSALERPGTHPVKPAWHQAAFGAIGVFTFLVAPLHRNVGSHEPTSATRYAGTFVTVLYISYVVMGLAFWVTRRVARRRQPPAAPAAPVSDDLPSPMTVPGQRVRRTRIAAAGVVPLAAVAAIMTLGAKHPTPAPEEAAAAAQEAPPPVHRVQVPALAGTTLSEQMVVSELTGHGAAIVPTLLAHDLTGVGIAQVWESAAEASDGQGQFDVFVTVDVLAAGSDRAKAAASMAAATTDDPLPRGWVDATADTTEPAAAHLLGDRVIVVRASGAGAPGDARLRALLPQLTDARLTALASAVTAAH